MKVYTVVGVYGGILEDLVTFINQWEAKAYADNLLGGYNAEWKEPLYATDAQNENDIYIRVTELKMGDPLE